MISVNHLKNANRKAVTLDEEIHHCHSVYVPFVGTVAAPTLADDFQADKLVLLQHSYGHAPRDI